MYVIEQDNPDQIWTVGFYAPDGSWKPHEDFADVCEAERKCNYLNGGESRKLLDRILPEIDKVIEKLTKTEASGEV